MFKHRMDEGMAALSKRPSIVDGAQKLYNLSLQAPRLFFWNMTKNKMQELEESTAIEKRHKQISLGSGKVLPTLHRTRLPVLRLAFQKILGLPKRDILRRLMVAFYAYADRT